MEQNKTQKVKTILLCLYFLTQEANRCGESTIRDIILEMMERINREVICSRSSKNSDSIYDQRLYSSLQFISEFPRSSLKISDFHDLYCDIFEINTKKTISKKT
jgi:hypothetical protein